MYAGGCDRCQRSQRVRILNAGFFRGDAICSSPTESESSEISVPVTCKFHDIARSLFSPDCVVKGDRSHHNGS
jgi:hypothetical protein